MKKIFTMVVAISLTSVTSLSQSNSFGALNLSGGVGFGAYTTTSEVSASYLNGSFVISDRDTSTGVTTYGQFAADLGIIDFISAGVYFQTGKYLQEKEDGVTKDNSLWKLGIMPKIYLINKDKFNLNLGFGFAIERLRTSEENGNTSAEAKYSGTNMHFRLGTNFYFTNSVGMFIHAGYDINKLTLNSYSYTVGNTTNTPDNLSGNLNADGLEMAIGLNIKFMAG